MIAQQWLKTDAARFELTDAGACALDELGVDLSRAQRSRRLFAPHCVDWSQRRPHVGGALGAALLDCYLKHGWMETGKGMVQGHR
jgi:hypothetical protein